MRFILMNSFSTSKDTKDYLSKHHSGGWARAAAPAGSPAYCRADSALGRQTHFHNRARAGASAQAVSPCF